MNSPEKIDKFTDIQELSFAKTFFGAIMHMPTNASWKFRKTTFTKTIGLNFASRYISLMLKYGKIMCDQWKVGDKVEFIPHINRFTLNVIASIILGNDFEEKFRKLNYTHKDGRIELIDVYKFFPILGKDLVLAIQMPMNLLFPTLIRNNIGHVNRINNLNCLEFRKALREFLEVTTDPDSCYSQIIRDEPRYKREDLFLD